MIYFYMKKKYRIFLKICNLFIIIAVIYMKGKKGVTAWKMTDPENPEP